MKPKAGAHITHIIQVPYFVDEKDIAPLVHRCWMLDTVSHNLLVTEEASYKNHTIYIKHFVPSIMLSVLVSQETLRK